MYTLGDNRVFYRAAGFRDGVTVTGKLLDKLLVVVQDNVLFTGATDGMYFCTITFPRYDLYLLKVYEGGTISASQTFDVVPPSTIPGQIMYDGRPVF